MWFWYAIANNSFVARTADGWDGADPLHLHQIGVADVENGAAGKLRRRWATITSAKTTRRGLEVAPGLNASG
jgi:hypothetical protein